MNKYFFEQKIKTLSDLEVGLNGGLKSPKMEIDNYIFEHWNFNLIDTHIGNAWVARKKVEAKNFIEAINIFMDGLDKIIQKIGFISQCYMDFHKESFLFYKLNDNVENIFFYKHRKEMGGNSLCFNERELSNYKKLESFEFQESFRFLQECRNTIGYIPRLVLLFSALEAMCGKKETERENGTIYITYDKDEMKKILGCKLYDEVFGNNGIRHKLNHGEMVDSVFREDYVKEIYDSIICYFNTEHKTNIKTSIVKPLRHFYDNYVYSNYWLKPENDFEITLKNCEENFNKENNSIIGCEYMINLDYKKY